MTDKLPYIRAEIASTPREQEKGLMWRKHLPKESGMLFDFKRDMPLAFWMKNTYIPLQIAFINSSGRILQVSSMAPLSTKRIFSARECRYALEVNEGWFDENKIKVGDYVEHPSGKWPEKEDGVNLFHLGQVVVPTNTTQPPPGFEGAEVQNQEQGQQEALLPTMQILDSWKDIFKRADELSVPLVIEWHTKDDFQMPRTQISPPYELGKTADGVHEGLLIAWSDREGHVISPMIENIVGVFDISGNPVNSVAQVEKTGWNTPLSKEEENLALGVQGKTPETENI
jgi:hypothetical protein